MRLQDFDFETFRDFFRLRDQKSGSASGHFELNYYWCLSFPTFKTPKFEKKTLKLNSTMENVIQNPGLQHITEMILFNLDFEDLQKCQILKKSLKDILEDSMFWLKKWKMQRGLSKENYDDWIKAIKLIKNTDTEANIKLYLEKIIENSHIVDIPCFIDSHAVEKSTQFTFERALEERELGILQILASIDYKPSECRVLYCGIGRDIRRAAFEGHLNIIRILAPITSNPNFETLIHFAAMNGQVDVLKFLAPLTKNPNSNGGCTPRSIQVAQQRGHHELARFLQIITTITNTAGKTPIEVAQKRGHQEFARILQSFMNTGKCCV